MPSRSGPVHVAKITRKTHGKTYVSYLLRRTFRQGDQVKHETLGNLSHLPTAVIDAVRRMLRGEVLVGLRDRFRILRARPHGHVAAVLGTLRHLGLEQLLGSRRSRQRDLVAGMIVGRLLNLIKILQPDGSSLSLQPYIFQHIYLPIASPINASLLYAISFILVMYLVVWVMWKRRWFIKI